MNSKNSSVNAILIALVGILVGFIGGYLVGQNRAPQFAGGTGIGGGQSFAGASTCPHALSADDNWIIAGFRCPGTDDSQALLVDCHCPVAHSLQDLVRADIRASKTGEQIREQIVAQYGDRLNFGYRPPADNP